MGVRSVMRAPQFQILQGTTFLKRRQIFDLCAGSQDFFQRHPCQSSKVRNRVSKNFQIFQGHPFEWGQVGNITSRNPESFESHPLQRGKTVGFHAIKTDRFESKPLEWRQIYRSGRNPLAVVSKIGILAVKKCQIFKPRTGQGSTFSTGK